MIRVVGDGGLAREMVQLVRIVLAEEAEPTSLVQEAELRSWGRAVLGLGHPAERLAAFRKLREVAEFVTLIHPGADVGDTTVVGEGAVITSGVVTTTDIAIGPGSLLNLNVTVGHDALLGECCVVNPGATISGGVMIGDAVLVGTGANILEGRMIGDGAVVGAGSVVTKDVAPGAVVLGVPARPMKAQ